MFPLRSQSSDSELLENWWVKQKAKTGTMTSQPWQNAHHHDKASLQHVNMPLGLHLWAGALCFWWDGFMRASDRGVGLLCAKGSRSINGWLLPQGFQAPVDLGGKKGPSGRSWESGSRRGSWWKWLSCRVLVERGGIEKRRGLLGFCLGWVCTTGSTVTGWAWEAGWAGAWSRLMMIFGKLGILSRVG